MRINNGKKRRRGSDGSFWLSFSDLMSTLVMIFILILFYSMYQYFDMYEIKEAELARQQFDLESANDQLAEEQDKLTQAEQQLIAQQIKLQAAEQGLTETEAILEQQRAELDSANSLLTEKEAELTALSEQLSLQQQALDNQQLQITTQQDLLDTQQQQLEQLVGLRTQIIVALSDALKASNITAVVDQATGAIALESDVMFDTGKATLSASGKKSIDEFLPVYLDVLLSDEYRDFVSEIIVEGHTDSNGGYIMNLELSQQRALAVASYILDDGYRAITSQQKATLREITTANGRSYSDRIMVNGVEDEDASRRVVFKFRMTDEQMIEQMQQILEESAAAQEAAAAATPVPTAEPATEASAVPEVTPEPVETPAPAP